MKIDELTRIPKVIGVGLATDDGFVVESRFAVGYDAEKAAAMAAQVVHRIKQSLDIKKTSVLLYTQNNVHFIKEIADGIVFVICQKDANIGLVKIRLDKLT